MESLKRAAGWIRSRPGFSFVVLPEGTRTRDGRLGPFKRGGFLLALETGLEILPLVQIGRRRINRKGSRLIRPGRVRDHDRAGRPHGRLSRRRALAAVSVVARRSEQGCPPKSRAGGLGDADRTPRSCSRLSFSRTVPLTVSPVLISRPAP